MVVKRGSAEAPDHARTNDVVLIAINRSDSDVSVALPEPREGHRWAVGIDTSIVEQHLRPLSGDWVTAPAQSILAMTEVPKGTGA